MFKVIASLCSVLKSNTVSRLLIRIIIIFNTNLQKRVYLNVKPNFPA